MMSISSHLEAFRRFSSKSRAAGSADVTARLQLVSWWYRLPLYFRLLAVIGIIVAGAGIGYTTGYSPVIFALWTAAITLTAGAFILAPQAGALFLVTILTAPLLLPLGYAYTVGENPQDADPVGGAIALGVAYGIGLWIAVRWSRGRAWVTATFMTAAILFLGPLLLFVFPPLGLNAARIAVATVLLLRCGGAAWLVGVVGLFWSRLRNRSHLEDAEGYAAADPGDISAAWRRRAAVEKETATILANMPKPFRVFHDVTTPRGHNRIGHLVIGPSGITLVASVHAIGPVQEATKTGLVVPGVELDSVVAGLVASKPQVAKALKCHPRDVSLLIVVHGKDACLDSRIRVAVHHAAAPGKALENVSLVPSDELINEIVSPFSTWSSVKIQQTIRRAQMKLRPSVLPITVKQGDKDKEGNMTISRLDADGHLIDLADGNSSYAPGVLAIGARVDVETTLGPLKGLRVLSTPVIDSKGERVIYVCSEDEYLEASVSGIRPKGHSFPVASIRLADAHR